MDLRNLVAGTLAKRMWNLGAQDEEGLRYPDAVSLWARWVFLIACLVESNYRICYGALAMSSTRCTHWSVMDPQRLGPRHGRPDRANRPVPDRPHARKCAGTVRRDG